MREFLIAVSSPNEAPAFALAMAEAGLPCRDAARETEWLSAVHAKQAWGHDARLFIVSADARETVDVAVEEKARAMRSKWIEGAPLYDVLDDREPQSYPASDMGPTEP